MKNIFCIVIFLAFLFSISSAGFAEESTTIDKDWKFSHLLANHEWPKDITPRDLKDRKFYREYNEILGKDIYYFPEKGKDFYGYENMELFCFTSNIFTEIRYHFSKLKDADESMKLYNKLVSYLCKKFPNISAYPGIAILDNKKLQAIILVNQKTNRVILSFSQYPE